MDNALSATVAERLVGDVSYLRGATGFVETSGRLSPDNEVFVAVAATVFVVDDGKVVVAVAEVTEGCCSYQVDRVVDLHVYQSLGEVVE